MTSDRRLKKDVKPLTRTLRDFLKPQAGNFRFRRGGRDSFFLFFWGGGGVKSKALRFASSEQGLWQLFGTAWLCLWFGGSHGKC